MDRRLRALYVCYLSLDDPLVETQVLAYLEGLARAGHTVHLLTWETRRLSSSERRAQRVRLATRGIAWHGLTYHKRPSLPATAFDVLCGVVVSVYLIRRHRLNAIHARSHVPAAGALLVAAVTRCRLIFDVRGLMAEEYVDAGNWTPRSAGYRLIKRVQRRAIARADGIVVLTERVRALLFGARGDARVTVIPCCADLARLDAARGQRAAWRERLGVADGMLLAYVGKLGTWYMAAEMVDFFVAARERRGDLHFLILTQSDAKPLRDAFDARGVAPHMYTITRAGPEQVAGFLAAADLAISFVRASPSKISSSPTKIGEYLGAGLPIVCGAGVGDLDALLGAGGVGVLVDRFDPAGYGGAADRVFALLVDRAATAERCRALAQRELSLSEVAIPRYDALYRRVASRLRA